MLIYETPSHLSTITNISPIYLVGYAKTLELVHQVNVHQISPTRGDLASYHSKFPGKKMIQKINCTILFIRHYIYSTKLIARPFSIHEFTIRLRIKVQPWKTKNKNRNDYCEQVS